MSGLRYAVVPLRIVLVLTFLLLLVAEVMSFPGMFSYQARQSDDFAEVRWPLLAVVELGLICVQVVIVSTWRLLTMVREDRVFSRDSLRWVDAILAAIGVAWLLGLGMVLVVVAAADDPGNVMAAMLILLPATSFALLMVVMRALLVQATELRSDMEGVI
ncbi:MAG: hypothetical protein JWM86_2809 [Thermoleophilia bacterium]|nr:hypothetical protein [Thermoleophilia bacterium]